MFRRLGWVFVFCSIFAATAANANEEPGAGLKCMYKCGEEIGHYGKCLYICGYTDIAPEPEPE